MSINKEDFVKARSEFELGALATEGINPKTRNLSALAQSDLGAAIEILQEVDLDALCSLEKRLEAVHELRRDIQQTLASGGRIFISGCGATGRLAIALETFWRSANQDGQVVGFMAGGDYALIKSVESFEDKMAYGSRQLEELGFGENDLLLAVTEGGETSFVIGSALWAGKKSNRKPYFIYCNPDEQLLPIARSRSVLENPRIAKLNLDIGAMAISGSTRMQATTVQMLAIGLALFLKAKDKAEFLERARIEIKGLAKLSLNSLVPFIKREAGIYAQEGVVSYAAEPSIAITILTDTTERSPTFSLQPFEKLGEKHLSLSYLTLKGAQDSKQAWQSLLNREPRGLSWPDLAIQVDEAEIHKFDISQASLARRSGDQSSVFEVTQTEKEFKLKFGEHRGEIPKPSGYHFINQVALKMAFNILSTLIMGRMGRYEGNLMTYVRPSNFKLVDRAVRYVIELGEREGLELTYMEVVDEIFIQIPALGPDEPVVLKTLDAIKRRKA